MHAFLTNLTAFSLFIHALVGCCWHHAHTCDCQEELQVANALHVAELQANGSQAIQARAAACCHDCHPTNDEQPQPPAPCKCNLECHGVCTYLPPQKTQLDSNTVARAFDVVPPPLDPVDHAALRAIPWELVSDPGESIATLRIHLLHQVFLI